MLVNRDPSIRGIGTADVHITTHCLQHFSGRTIAVLWGDLTPLETKHVPCLYIGSALEIVANACGVNEPLWWPYTVYDRGPIQLNDQIGFCLGDTKIVWPSDKGQIVTVLINPS